MPLALPIRFDGAVLRRMIAAGGAWGIALAVGFFAIGYAQCGLPCPEDAAVTTLVCIGAGIVTIGPLAAGAPRS